MYGMYMINGVYRREPRSSGGNTSSNQQASVRIPRSAFNGMKRMCQRHGSNQTAHPPVLVQKTLCNQFIRYHISSTGVFGINHFKLRNFAVVAIICLQQLTEAVLCYEGISNTLRNLLQMDVHEIDPVHHK